MNSVVIRGIVNRNTSDVVNAIRKWHDGEIILSTWDNYADCCKDFSIDKLITSKDPGRVHPHNIRRQILLANKGVAEAKGKKILLTRTDVLHKKNCFENISQGKITIIDFYCMNPDYNYSGKNLGYVGQFKPVHKLFFKVSDFIQWGYAKEIMDWSSGFVKDFLWRHSEKKHSRRPASSIEQMWCVAYLNKRGYDIKFPELSTSGHLRWSALKDNFLLMSHNQMDVKILNPKYPDLENLRKMPWCLNSDLFNTGYGK